MDEEIITMVCDRCWKEASCMCICWDDDHQSQNNSVTCEINLCWECLDYLRNQLHVNG